MVNHHSPPQNRRDARPRSKPLVPVVQEVNRDVTNVNRFATEEGLDMRRHEPSHHPLGSRRHACNGSCGQYNSSRLDGDAVRRQVAHLPACLRLPRRARNRAVKLVTKTVGSLATRQRVHAAANKLVDLAPKCAPLSVLPPLLVRDANRRRVEHHQVSVCYSSSPNAIQAVRKPRAAGLSLNTRQRDKHAVPGQQRVFKRSTHVNRFFLVLLLRSNRTGLERISSH